MMAHDGWIVCGRFVGIASAWDEVVSLSFYLYDFYPAPGYKGPIGKDVAFFFEKGIVETYDDEGKVTGSMDLIDAINECERRRIS